MILTGTDPSPCQALALVSSHGDLVGVGGDMGGRNITPPLGRGCKQSYI